MPATESAVKTPATTGARRNEKVGNVVSTKMQKTIVVEVEMRKAHAKYKRIVRSTKKFYAHDEQSSARMGDVVRIRETRPLSKLKRWSLEEIVRRSSLGQIEDTTEQTANKAANAAALAASTAAANSAAEKKANKVAN
jgi:small subunit ribosomal protein S17